MIGKVSCVVPGCTAEYVRESCHVSQYDANGYARIEARRSSWTYQSDKDDDNYAMLCPAHKGWMPEQEKATITCDCGATLERPIAIGQTQEQARYSAVLEAKSNGWGYRPGEPYLETEGIAQMSCPDCMNKQDTPVPDESPVALAAKCDELQLRLDGCSAVLHRIASIIGLPNLDRDPFPIFARLRELVAKEGQQ